ncbi:MAG: DUF433 domain-containing protein [Leptospiraceae bacterium]|nr:DUF433 domain-containing protein [Leptospiraceae bacterium]MCP5499223.1 DUF433 domain-containing protein [Leptospiraceae bacterium]
MEKISNKEDFIEYYKQVVTIDPETMSGTPVFPNSRVPIQALFDYLETESALKEFREDFPGVSKEKILEVLNLSSYLIHHAEELLNENPS